MCRDAAADLLKSHSSDNAFICVNVFKTSKDHVVAVIT